MGISKRNRVEGSCQPPTDPQVVIIKVVIILIIHTLDYTLSAAVPALARQSRSVSQKKRFNARSGEP